MDLQAEKSVTDTTGLVPELEILYIAALEAFAWVSDLDTKEVAVA